MKKWLIIPLAVLLFFGCDSSDQYPKEKAERLAQQADEEINKQNYEDAERLLAECIAIHSETKNEAKLAESYATLSSAQMLSGKITATLETLTALRELYKFGADRNAELHVMFQMSKLYFKLGNTAESIHLLHDAFTNSGIYRLDQLRAQAGYEAGIVHLQLHQYDLALVYLSAAHQYYKAAKDVQNLVETKTAIISSLVPLGKTDEAYTHFQETESLFGSGVSVLDRPRFYRIVGDVFSSTSDMAFARANFLQAISLIDRSSGAGLSEEKTVALIGLGELYYNNFSFAEAQQYYVAAYAIAKNRSDNYHQAYLLTRISDCLVKVSAVRNSKDGMIRASQLYEQAHTVFSRMGFGLGEAITIHRLGILKELAGDESAAISFYKRAFDKYLDNTMQPELYTLSVPVEQLYKNASRTYTAEEWFSDRLVSVLLRAKRYPEALTYYEMVRSVSLQNQLKNIPLNFRDPEKRARYADVINGMREKTELQLELFHLQNASRNYAAKLQQRQKFIRSKVESDAVTLMRQYPVFSYIGFSQQSLRQMIDTKLPPVSTVIDYCFVNNEMWAFFIRPDEDISAMKLSSFGNSLTKKMEAFLQGCSSPVLQRSMMTELASDLGSILLKPLEPHFSQKLIVIPPLRFSQFPFHALLRGGKSAVEMNSIAYMPLLPMINSSSLVPRFVNTVAAFGFTPDFRWGLEFELRDTRSFFKNTAVQVSQSATPQKLDNALGEILQISSQYTKNNQGEFFFTLSDGTASKTGTSVPISRFASLHPFPIVYLSNIQPSSNTVSELHPAILMLNGSASVVTTPFPITSAISKIFGENYYSSLSSEINPSLAYRRALVQLGKRKDLREGFGGASYFYYGCK